MEISNITTRRPTKGGLSLQERAREWGRGKPTLEQEAARLRGLARKAEEAADAHTCPECGERRYSVPLPTGNRLECGCNRPLPPEQAYERLFKRSGLPATARARWADILPTPARSYALAHCRDMLENGGGWLTLYGAYGGGKSYLATATANEFMHSGRSAMVLHFGDFLDAMKRAFSPEAPEDAGELFERATTVECLVIDELDRFQPSAWAVGRLSNLYHRRYVARDTAATIWLTNAQPVSSHIPPGAEWLGPLYSRISEYPVVHMCDADIRPALGQAKVAHLPPPPDNW